MNTITTFEKEFAQYPNLLALTSKLARNPDLNESILEILARRPEVSGGIFLGKFKTHAKNMEVLETPFEKLCSIAHDIESYGPDWLCSLDSECEKLLAEIN